MDYHIPILMSATGPFRYCKDGFHDSASYRRDTFWCGPSPVSTFAGYSSSSSTAGKPSRAVPSSVRDQRIVRPAFTPSTNPSPCSSLSLSRRVGAVTPSASCNSVEVGATGARKICTCPSRYSSRRTSSRYFEVSPGVPPVQVRLPSSSAIRLPRARHARSRDSSSSTKCS